MRACARRPHERSCCSTRARRSAGSSPSRLRRPTDTGGARCWTSTRTRSRACELRLGTPVRADELAGFDEVVLAVGSTELLPDLPGIERALPSSAAIGRRLSGRSLLVVDDGFGWWPCASAVELGVRAGFESITVATPGAAFGASLPAGGPGAAARAPARRPAAGASVHGARQPRRGQRGAEEHDVRDRRERSRRHRHRGRRAHRARLERARARLGHRSRRSATRSCRARHRTRSPRGARPPSRSPVRDCARPPPSAPDQAIRTSVLPIVSPASVRTSASGACSSPSTIVSRQRSRPSASQRLTSRTMSGIRCR